MIRILLVDDEANILKALTRVIHVRRAWDVVSTTSPAEALSLLDGHHFDLILSDYRMPEMDGVTFLKAARRICPDAARLILSGQADMNAVLQAINEAEIYRFITKPWEDDELLITLDKALEHQQLIVENARLAAEVKRQRAQIREQLNELRRLEAEAPGITRLNLDDEGYIVLDEDDLDDVDLDDLR